MLTSDPDYVNPLVAVRCSKNNAILEVHHTQTPARPTNISWYILGDSKLGWELHSKDVSRYYCPGALGYNIVENLSIMGHAKHTTFRKSGNAFSRIAYLIQIGYSLPGHTSAGVNVHSSVHFSWKRKDLVNYISKWTEALKLAKMLKATNADCEEAARFLEHRSGVKNIYFAFETDYKLSILTGGQLKLIERKQEEEQQAGNMIYF